jgi:CDP-diacylglycerol---glycerol-3-phosphate 3-phosphatidyltransferase
MPVAPYTCLCCAPSRGVGYNPLGVETVLWNLPNSLTMARILMVPLLVVVLLTRFSGSEFWGLGIFLIAVLTDLFDGMIARRTKKVTTAGMLLDPIADKLLMSSAFISLVELGLAPAWMVVIFVGREFAVTGLRQIAQLSGVIMAANWWGKLKTLSQVVAVCFLIVNYQLGLLALIGKATLWLALFMTIASLIAYSREFWRRVLKVAA